MRVCLLTCCLAILVSTASPQTWEIEVVDNGKQFSQMTDRSLRLDAEGNPHIAYGEDHLYYAFHDGIAWHYEVADLSYGVGLHASLALDGSGYPHISYYDATNGDLKYARASGQTVIELTASLNEGQLVLSWTPVVGAAAYWAYGTSNEPWFAPDTTPPIYVHRVAVVPTGTTTWSSPNGVGDPNANWIYLVMAVAISDQELIRSNRAGEHDFQGDIPLGGLCPQPEGSAFRVGVCPKSLWLKGGTDAAKRSARFSHRSDEGRH